MASRLHAPDPQLQAAKRRDRHTHGLQRPSPPLMMKGVLASCARHAPPAPGEYSTLCICEAPQSGPPSFHSAGRSGPPFLRARDGREREHTCTERWAVGLVMLVGLPPRAHRMRDDNVGSEQPAPISFSEGLCCLASLLSFPGGLREGQRANDGASRQGIEVIFGG